MPASSLPRPSHQLRLWAILSAHDHAHECYLCGQEWAHESPGERGTCAGSVEARCPSCDGGERSNERAA